MLGSQFLVEQISLGNLLTIVSIVVMGMKLNNSFVSKFASLESKVEAMWAEYTHNRNGDRN